MPEKLFFAVSAFSLDTLLLCSRQNFPLYFVMGSFPPATAPHFQNFSKSYLLHSLQVAITTGKSKKHGAIDWTCQMDFKCSRLTRLCQHFWSNVPSPFVAGGYRVLLHSLQVAIESNCPKNASSTDPCQKSKSHRDTVPHCKNKQGYLILGSEIQGPDVPFAFVA